jgi:molybdopterin/thiamine biosynthesis adenylyltransferase
MIVNDHLTRQIEILPYEKCNIPITVIGAGAVGSFVVLSLAKMGFETIQVFDDDTIEVENMNCQFYRFKDIGKPKVLALQELVKDFTNVSIDARNERYIGGSFKGVVISAVDSMEVRKLIWNNHKELSPSTKFIIDPRMGAETAMLYTMSPMDSADILSYEKTLYTDANAMHERCTAKATTYTALLLSGLVAKTVKDIVTNGPYPRTAIWSIKDNDFQAWSK